MITDTFTTLWAFSSDGHYQLTCMGVALAVARLLLQGKTGLVTQLGELYQSAKKSLEAESSWKQIAMEPIKKAYRDEMDSLPDNAETALHLFFDMPDRVVSEDVHTGNIVGYVAGAGAGEASERDNQVRHFMRSRPEVSSDQAYNASVKYIRDNLTSAWNSFNKAMGERDNHPFFTDPVGVDTDSFLFYLAKALHTVEDSYAPGHVTRNAHELIEEVHIWDDANKKPDPDNDWPGHTALDDPAHPKSASHFRAGKYAVQDAILCIATNLNQTDATFQAALNGVIAKHFSGLCVK
jgi:hypothetical protein